MKYFVTIGNFDGFHIGHQNIISELKRLAKKFDANTRLYSFDFHTRNLSSLILDEKNKESMAYSLGIDSYELLHFSDIKDMSPIEFLNYIDNDILGIVVGEDFRFGKDRLGSVDDIVKYAKDNNLIANIIPDVIIDSGEKISSSSIRKLISNGDIKKANEQLGYNFFATGIVEEGYKRGREIGFKTANISWSDEQIKPKDGVYYTKIIVDGKIYDSMTMAGIAKTFNHSFSCETNIFDFDRFIYGHEVKLIFLDFIRENKKFNSIDGVRAQLEKDKIKCLELAKGMR